VGGTHFRTGERKNVAQNDIKLCIFGLIRRENAEKLLKVRFHHQIFETNLRTNSLTKLPYKQMSHVHIFVLFVSQKFVANQIGFQQTHHGNFASKFVIKFVAKM
jgi:hypothetical protein